MSSMNVHSKIIIDDTDTYNNQEINESDQEHYDTDDNEIFHDLKGD